VDLSRIAVRAVSSYLVALVLVRLSGKRVVAQATPFDFAIALVLGDLFDDLIWAEVAASQFVAAAGAIFLPAAAVEVASSRSGRFYDIVNGLPAVVLRSGKTERKALRNEQLSRADLEHLLRLDGIGPEEWETVKLGIVEHDHHLAVILEPWAEPVQRRDAEKLRRPRE
jgi:uncharacterized membrane protein YcaP (DUF421 family)